MFLRIIGLLLKLLRITREKDPKSPKFKKRKVEDKKSTDDIYPMW